MEKPAASMSASELHRFVTVEQARDALQEKVGLPAVDSSFASRWVEVRFSAIAYNKGEFDFDALRPEWIGSITDVTEVLIEESIIGWKEYEMEVMRDLRRQCRHHLQRSKTLIAMGVHTGDSITVAPAQTLSDKEYQRMRDASLGGHSRDRSRNWRFVISNLRSNRIPVG